MFARGTKQTLMPSTRMSAFGAKADLKWCWLESPLLTQSGHLLARRNREQTQTSNIFQEADIVTGEPLKAPRQICL